MTQISSKKSYVAIPVSIFFHITIAFLLLINWVKKTNLESSNQKVTLIEFDKEFLKSDVLVERRISRGQSCGGIRHFARSSTAPVAGGSPQ